MASDVNPRPHAYSYLTSFYGDRAFLVKETCLDILFQSLVCTICQCCPQNAAKYVEGDCLFVTVFCPSGHRLLRWSSRYAEQIETQIATNKKPTNVITDATSLNATGGVTERLKVVKRTADEAVPSSTRSPAAEVNDGATHSLAPASSFVSQTSNDEHQGYSEQSLEEQPELTDEIIIKVEQEEKVDSLSDIDLQSRFQEPSHAGHQMTEEPTIITSNVLDQTCDLPIESRSQSTSRSPADAPRSASRKTDTSPKVPLRKHLCSFCNKQFTMGYSVKIHERMHRRRNRRKYSYFSCATTLKLPFCRRKCGIPWRRRCYPRSVKHKSWTSQRPIVCKFDESDGQNGAKHIQDSRDSTVSLKPDETDISEVRQKFNCLICQKPFRNLSTCQTHQQRHFPWDGKILATVLKKKKMRRPWFVQPTHGERRSADASTSKVSSMLSIHCQICGNVFSTTLGKWVHRCTLSELKPHCCQLCPREFVSKSLLKDHLKVHIVEKQFSCEKCDKRFASASSCEQHEKTHPHRGPYQCRFCDNFFETGRDRKEHEENSHSDQKIIRCQFCHKIFKNVRLQKVHEKKHLPCDLRGEESTALREANVEVRKETKEPSEDDKNLISRNILEESSTVSSKVSGDETKAVALPSSSAEKNAPVTNSCKFCGKEFSSHSRLETHEYTHRHVSPYRCLYCSKSFVTESTLKWHAYTDHQLQCRVCHKQFHSPQVRGEHEQIHHFINRCESRKMLLTDEPADLGFTVDVEGHLQEKEETGSSISGDGAKRKESPVTSGYRVSNNKEHERLPGVSQGDACLNVTPTESDDTYQMQSPAEAIVKTIGVPEDECSPNRTPDSSSWSRAVPSQEGEELNPDNEATEEGTGLSEERLVQEATAKLDIDSLCCRYCGKQLSSKTSRKYHERIHTGEKPHKCSYCPKAFSDTSMLKTHERIHTGEKPFTCSFCDKKFFQSSHRRSHERVHTGEKPYQCSFCGDRFTTSSWRHKHEEKFHSAEKRYHCEYCSQVFSRSQDYGAHMKQHREEWSRMAGNGEALYQPERSSDEFCPEEEGTNESDPSADVKSTAEQDEQKNVSGNSSTLQTIRPARTLYPCHFCDKVLYAEGNRKVHERKHMDEWSIKCRFCEQRFPNAEHYMVHEVGHTGERPYRCRYCDECFDRTSRRTDHEYVHTKDFAFGCQHCDMKFASQPECTDHELLHSGKPYKCQLCDKLFSFTAALRDHEITCGLLKPYRCKFCGKQYAKFKVYKAHLDTHGSDRPFMCTKCGKTFRTTTDVNKHELIHTEGTPFQCQFCDKAFKTLVSAKKHEQTHSAAREFQCRYCEKRFKTKPSRDVHERCHTGEKPYQCAYCDLKLGSITARRTHHLLHTGEVPHKCKYCNRPFRHSSSLKRHLRLHTGEKPYKCKHCGELFRDIKQCRNHELKHTGERPFMCSFCGKAFRDKMQLVKHERIHTGERPYKCLYCEERFAFCTSRRNHMRRFHKELLAADEEKVTVYKNETATEQTEMKA